MDAGMFASSAPRLTISILARNEATNIERCVRSAAFADEIVVIDNGSQDNTVELALAGGAQVFVYPDWQGFAHQRNHQLRHAHGEYLLLLDADEEILPALREEILQVVASGNDTVLGLLTLEVAFGRVLKYAAPRKASFRFFKTKLLKGFEGLVHEKPVFTREITKRGFFKNKIKHFSRPTVRGSLNKLSQYAMLGASKRSGKQKAGGVIRGLLSGGAAFVQTYVFKRGFTGAGAGFLFCLFIALEAFFRYAALHYDRPDATDYAER
jgi:glycosyltransferase involved in cell wall biosynthesis